MATAASRSHARLHRRAVFAAGPATVTVGIENMCRKVACADLPSNAQSMNISSVHFCRR
jgi:hypothetical protein